MRIILILIILFNFSAGFSQDNTFCEMKIDSAINSFKARWEIPGISVAIAREGRLIYAKGFGYADTLTKEPVTVNSLFRIASCSKTITAIGIMKLFDEKKLDIDALVFGEQGILNDSMYLKFTDERIKKITVRNLLQQTIGWNNTDIIGSIPELRQLGTLTPKDEDVLNYYLKKGLDFEPASEHRYSNMNYGILGIIIEKTTGFKYDEYIQKEILQPLGISSAQIGSGLPERKLNNEVFYYDSNPELSQSVYDTTKMVPNSYGGFYFEAMPASGDWVSRPIDLVKIILAVDGQSHYKDILNKETVALMRTTPAGMNSHYAMGCIAVGDKWYHSGALTWGTSALMFQNSDDVCFAITCNTLPTMSSTQEEVHKMLLQYNKELHELLPTALKNITSYSNIDLFNKYN